MHKLINRLCRNVRLCLMQVSVRMSGRLRLCLLHQILFSFFHLYREFFCELHMLAVLAVFVLADFAQGFLYAIDKFMAGYGLEFKISHL